VAVERFGLGYTGLIGENMVGMERSEVFSVSILAIVVDGAGYVVGLQEIMAMERVTGQSSQAMNMALLVTCFCGRLHGIIPCQ
jgi:hypothetical protein